MHSRPNTGTDIEGFLPTVAMYENMKVAAFPGLRHPEHGMGILHCCLAFAGAVYAQWYNDSSSCLPGYMVHAIKNKESFWPVYAVQSAIGPPAIETS